MHDVGFVMARVTQERRDASITLKQSPITLNASFCVPIFVVQVGIVAVNLLGDKLGKLAPGALDAPPAPFGAGPRVVPGYAPERGGRAIGAGRVGRNEMNDLSFDMNFDPETAQRIRNIAAAKDKAVRSEVRQ